MPETRVKICGLTRPEDVAACHCLGVDFTGFVMAPESPRSMTGAAVAAIPAGSAKRVGVFTTGDVAGIARSARQARLDYVQLHGGQDAAFCRAIGPERVIRVFWPEAVEAHLLQEYIYHFSPVSAYFLFDAGRGGGGSGRSFSWDMLRSLDIPRPWFLAGGIDPATAGKALAACSPFALDVNSGVESSPGVKDAVKIRELLENI